ncbi:MAG: hypothetical protein NTV22_15250 [bacterium]|nr:hypothetical protein [bacterium]
MTEQPYTRLDGAGDTWARAHGAELPHNCLMSDLDAATSVTMTTHVCEGALFAEYVRRTEQTALVALFDRKARTFDDKWLNPLWLHICRACAQCQPLAPRLFTVLGDAAPYELREYDIHTGDRIRTTMLASDQWQVVWNDLGLLALRVGLSRWLFNSTPPQSC